MKHFTQKRENDTLKCNSPVFREYEKISVNTVSCDEDWSGTLKLR